MPTPKIQVKPCRILIQPSNETSSFATETKKYDRHAIGTVQGVYIGCSMKPGDQVIYDDSNAIEFSMNGVSYEIVNVEDIAAFIQEVE